MKKFLGSLVLSVALIGAPACVKTPPTLTPVAQQDFYKTQVIHALDILRDTAIAANAQKPPVLNTVTTRAIVQYHESSLKIMDASASGWSTAVGVGLVELTKNVSPSEASFLAPYVSLIQTALSEVQ